MISHAVVKSAVMSGGEEAEHFIADLFGKILEAEREGAPDTRTSRRSSEQPSPSQNLRNGILTTVSR